MRLPIPAVHWIAFLSLSTLLSGALLVSQASAQDRLLGLDVSYWQGHIQQSHWDTVYDTGDRHFVYIRSTRGGTTGVDQPQGTPGGGSLSTLSRRYDDPRFVQNITRSTQAGLMAGAYHFSRPDIVTNTGADEADHFMEMAGAWMRPGYLLPVHDLEAGDGFRTSNDIAQFTLDFSDRMYDVMGIRPAIYMNGNYANFVLGGASFALRQELVEKYPVLWSARYPAGSGNPYVGDLQTDHPKDSYSPIYGPWDDYGTTHPWTFWQYSSGEDIPGLTDSTVDGNVLQGGIELLKDNLVPAIWMNDSSGNWNTLTNWNSGQTPVQPPVASGQATPYATGPLPTPRLPGADDLVNNIDGTVDTVILDRPNADITVTLDSGIHQIRKLYLRETLNITGGVLSLNYVPSADSTPYSAEISAPLNISGGTLTGHTMKLDATETISLSGGMSFDELSLMPDSTTPAKLLVTGDFSLSSFNGETAKIVNGSGSGSSGYVDLNGGIPVWNIPDGTPAVDAQVDVPITNGGLRKSGAGILQIGLNNSLTDDTYVDEGMLRLLEPSLDDSSDVYLSTGANLNLGFLFSTDTIDALYIDGVSQPAGLWGAVGSGATYTSPLITGTGFLQVSTFDNIPSDLNGDGFVDGIDLGILLGNWGQNTTPDQGELDGTPPVDSLDLGILLGEWNEPPLASAATVPEPNTVLLATAFLLCFIASSRR